jgi:hypothetical protein
MATYVFVVDLGDAAGPMQYVALNHLMYEFGFTQRGPETLRPAQFSITSALPLGGIKHMVDDRIKAELQPEVVVDAYEMQSIVH